MIYEDSIRMEKNCLAAAFSRFKEEFRLGIVFKIEMIAFQRE